MNYHISSLSFVGARLKTLFYNDLHGSTRNLKGFLDIQDDYNPDLTLCGGDMFADVGENNETVAEVLGKRTDAAVVGNHDLDGGNYLNLLIEKFKMVCKWLSTNIFYRAKTPLGESVKKSTIIEKNGEKYGIIGVSPFDYSKLAFQNSLTSFIGVKDLNETKKEVKAEVERFEKLKVNKIFLLAHTGEAYYDELAKISGIDVVIGGHDHIEVDRWETTERGEPVKVVATGRSGVHGFAENLDYVGKLDLEFDDNGVLIKDKCQSEFQKVESSGEINPKDVIYSFDVPIKPSNQLLENSETANIIADSNLWYVNKYSKSGGADFAFVNSGALRGLFDKDITKDDIQCVLPFVSTKLIKAPLTKKQIINTLEWCALSTTFKKIAPGLMQVSGMEYTINPDLSVSNVHILNENGTIKYNLDDFDDDSEFVAVYDNFLMTGVIGLSDLKKDGNNERVEYFNVSRQEVLLEYLRTLCPLKDFEKQRINILK